MSSSIRIPEAVPIPDRDSFQDTFEKSTLPMDMEQGPARRRRARSIAPRRFSLTIKMTTAQYQEFDYWYQNAIQAGAAQFDIQLLDDDHTLVWYTVNIVGDYQYQTIGTDSDKWLISMTVRSKFPSFVTRAPGTNDLHGDGELGIVASGILYVPYVMRGIASLGFTPEAILGAPRMRGAAHFDVTLAALFSNEFFQGQAHIGLTSSGVLAPGYVMRSRADLSLSANGQLLTSATDPSFSHVSLLMHFNGTNGATSTTDSSTVGHSVSMSNAVLSSTQSKFGTTSLLTTPSTSGRAAVTATPPSDNLQVYSNEWTLEVWVYPTSAAASYVVNFATSNIASPITIIYTSGGVVRAQGFDSGGSAIQYSIDSNAAISLNTWTFIQVRRRVNTFELAINGTIQTATGSYAADLMATQGVDVGGTGSVTFPFPGFIDELRFTNGVARAFNLPTTSFPNS